jgi:beta-N-acetylhexosaminidase
MNIETEQPLGPVVLDIAGTTLSSDDRERLTHRLTGGVILFSRNFESAEQLAELTVAIHELRNPRLLISVDHEGGRVQRFREGFTAIPAMRALGRAWDADRGAAATMAADAGYVLAAELRACGVDMSFTPVLDVDFGESGVIGNRAFHSDPHAISQLAASLIAGLSEAGMRSVGKHFPGHGFVRADSHFEVPVDERKLADIEACDLLPYRELATKGLSAVMPAHVIYTEVDRMPAGYSAIWIQQVLRKELGFKGVVFSDDLSMEGASMAGGVVARAQAALGAGCDMVLVCNNPDAADRLLSGLHVLPDQQRDDRIASMYPDPFPMDLRTLRRLPRYQAALTSLARVAEFASPA